MKQGLVTKISMLVIAMFALTACPGKGGNNGAGAGVVAGACVIGAGGTCVNGTPYFGAGGKWSGTMNIVNPALFNQLMIEQGLCRGYSCQAIQQFIGLSINLSSSQGHFTISRASYGRWIKMARKNAQAYSSGVNGFNLVAQNYHLNQPFQTQVYPYQNGIVAPTVDTSIQIVSTFIDAQQIMVNTQLLYRGQVLATGQLQGRPNYYGGMQSTGYAPQVLPANRAF